MFGITINYPPNEDKKGEIKRINSEDIFPEKMAFPTLDHNEQCEHGNMFSPELKPGNIETTNMVIGNVLQDLWEFGREKKSPRFVGIISKICGNVGEKKKSPRFVGEIF